ncbi:MAG: archaeosortase/exosortase family protein [Candidatus Bathyarchaeota archaeon]|nr:archaeosortase/exosortase family protein [Candidatus Bathyarchaeota archaeon]
MVVGILGKLEARWVLFLKLLPVVVFAAAFLWLYFLDASSFELMWKGRTFQLFFIWLVCLELFLGWEELQPKKFAKFSVRTVALGVVAVLPVLYVAWSFYFGLNQAITDLSIQNDITWASSMPLSVEYLVFAGLFAAVAFLVFGFKGIKSLALPIFFLIIVGTLYTIDNIFPYGQFTPFQILVPTTTAYAAAILNLMGYTTAINYVGSDLQGSMPHLTATDPANPATTATFAVAWPCAGIESFLIFTVTILLFLKRMPLSWKAKLGYFIFGAAVTYTINALRIVNIFLIGMQGGNIDMFHFYYGPLYAVAWIVAYPLIILVAQNLWRKIRKTKPPRATHAQQALQDHA